jgi:predicted RNA-binding protein with RPS1 domain
LSFDEFKLYFMEVTKMPRKKAEIQEEPAQAEQETPDTEPEPQEIPQTEPETINTDEEVPGDLINNAQPQTETENEGIRDEAPGIRDIPQSESEYGENHEAGSGTEPGDNINSTDSQTEYEISINPAEGGEANISDNESIDSSQAKPDTHHIESENTAESTGTAGVTKKTAPRIRIKPENILAIDEERSVETESDKLRSDLLDLVESQKSRKILSGTIQGIERSADNPNLTYAVIYHGAFKVIIPAEETVKPPEDLRDRTYAEVMHYLVTKRLGAEVDYIVKGVDIESGMAAASRLAAMAIKRKQYYLGADRDGNNLIYEGLSAEARVVSVIRAGMFVDLFGIETYIPLRELSYQRWIDASAHYQPGQRVLVKVIKLDRSDKDNISVSVSVKQASENPYENTLKRYNPGSRYVGTVSMVDTNGVFVSLDGGIDCLCSYPKRGRPPRGARVTVRIIGVNEENNRIWGAITHMATAR